MCSDQMAQQLSPGILSSANPGQAAFEAIRVQMENALRGFMPGPMSDLCQTCLVFIFR